MRRNPRMIAAGAVLLVAALTGCGKVTGEALIYDDASYDMTVYMLGDDAELEAIGLTGTTLSDALVEEMEGTPGTDAWTFTSYSADGFSGVEAVGTAVSGDDVGLFGRGFIEEDDDVITLDLQYPMAPVTASFTPEQAAAIDITVVFEFPGEVIDHNGTLIDDYTVEFSTDASQDLDFNATSETSKSSGSDDDDATDEPSDDATTGSDDSTEADEADDADESEGINWLLWLSIALIVAALAGLVAWLVLRNRGKGGPGGPAGFGGPGGPAGQQPWAQQSPGGQPQWGQQPQGGQPQQQAWGQPGQQPWSQPPGQQPGQPGQQPGQPDQQPGQQPGQPGQPGQPWG